MLRVLAFTQGKYLPSAYKQAIKKSLWAARRYWSKH